MVVFDLPLKYTDKFQELVAAFCCFEWDVFCVQKPAFFEFASKLQLKDFLAFQEKEERIQKKETGSKGKIKKEKEMKMD